MFEGFNPLSDSGNARFAIPHHAFNADTPQQPLLGAHLSLNGPALERLLTRLVQAPEDVDAASRYSLRMAFYQTLLESIILTPVPKGTDLDSIADHGIPLLLMANPQGEKGMLVFTSETAMSYWVEETMAFVGIPFVMLCQHAVAQGLDFVVVNVAGPTGGEISYHELTYLAEGLIPPPGNLQSVELTLSKDTKIHLSAMPTMPEMLLERLYGVCAQKETQVERAYLFQCAFGDGGFKPSLAVFLSQTGVPLWEQVIWPDLQAMLQEVLGRKEYVNVFLLNESGNLEESLVRITPPVYPLATK